MTGFFARWSERAARARKPAAPDSSADAPPDGPESGAPTDRDDLPDLGSLGPNSDYRPFLQRTVAPTLRRLALRKLWQSDPVLANLDGLNDYDEDFAALHRTGADAVAAALRAGRRHARDPGASAEDNAASAPEAAPAAERPPADPETVDADPDTTAADGTEQPA